MQEMKRKYGLFVAVAMVVGIVIGSGIFFKTDDILYAGKNSVLIGLIALFLGAFAMIFGSLVFGEYASLSDKPGGLVDYVDYSFGKKPSYVVGFYQATIYLPAISSILAWVSSRYILDFAGYSNPVNSTLTWFLAFVLLIGFYVLNFYAPIISGKFQVSTTIIKLIPLLLIGIIAFLVGLFNSTLQENIKTTNEIFTQGGTLGALFKATVVTSFAYEGWIIATTINHEIRESKKNLPKALLLGTLIIAGIYILFYLGMVSFVQAKDINDSSVKLVASKLFGDSIFGNIVMFFVVISCLGTLNGLVLGSIRAPYSVAIRGNGIKPKTISKLDKNLMPLNSAIYSFICTSILIFIWWLNINEYLHFRIGNYKVDGLDSSSFPIAFLYFIYIILYMHVILKFKSISIFKRFIIPIFAIIGGIIIVIGGIITPSILIGLIISVIVCLLSLLLYNESKYAK